MHVQALTREETANIEHVAKAKEGNVSRGDPLSGVDELLRSNTLNRRHRSLPCTIDRMEMRIELQAVPIDLPVAGALQVHVYEDFRAVRAIDTTKCQLSVDLIVKVEGEDGFPANIHQIFHWSTKRPCAWRCDAAP